MKAPIKKSGGFSRNRTNTKNNDGLQTLSTGKIKKKIRDTQRTIEKSNVSAEALIASKRKLKALQIELGESLINEQERDMLNKYHKTRFFEKKKAHRKLKKAENKLKETPDDAALQAKRDEAAFNVEYIQHYPPSVPYVALYPTEDNQTNDATFDAKRESIKKRMKEAIANGDKDFKLMKRQYRDEYKQKLIKAGKLEEVAVDEDKMEEDKKEESDHGDDFFE
ncbi:hypothetical protein K501DRAFT_328111 [Backusella circina FSU 941]|nr:hypothetical protein K501DRAFT_328111 [Backusella circina FSU 941]